MLGALCILVQQSHGQLAKSKGNKDITALESEIFNMNATGITTDDTRGTTESIDNTGLPTTDEDSASATESELEDNYYTPYQGERLDDFDWLITRVSSSLISSEYFSAHKINRFKS